MNEQETDDGEEDAGGGLDVEVLKSYLLFAKRAIHHRRILAAAVFLGGSALAVLAFKNLPRTYNCHTSLLGKQNEVLEGRGGQHPLDGAAELIMRHENLASIIREANLAKKWEAQRPPLLKFKDRAMQALFGEWSDEIKHAIVLGTLEQRLTAKVEGSILKISIDWGEPKTAAEIAETAREGFIKTRHAAEVSAFQEKMDILDGHAGRLRDEIEQLAQQIRGLREEQLAEVNKAKSKAAEAAEAATAPRVASLSAPRRRAEPTDFELPALNEKLDAKTRKLADLQAEWDRNVRAERAKLAELKLKLSSSHPEVITQERRVAMAAQEPPELSVLRAETRSLQDDLQHRPSLGGGGSTASRRALAAGGSIDPLPTDVIELLDEEDLDPAVSAQLSGAIQKYGTLRSEIRTSRIDLDTAQAAFNHRYKVIVPAEAPNKAIKPKAAVVIGGGMFVSLLLALLLPILAELRRGVIIARWQVELVRLPILAELRLPPRSTE